MDEFSAAIHARGLSANLNPKGLNTIGDLWPDAIAITKKYQIFSNSTG